MTDINMSPEPEMAIKPNKNRQSLLLLLAVFALPIILAKLALEQQWLEFGVTNQGALLDKNLTLAELGIDQSQFAHQWLIIYRLPESCEQHCKKTLETVHNSYVALGKDMPRITPVLLKQRDFSPEQTQRLSKSQWQVLPMPSQTLARITSAQILIADPLGNVMLSYDPVSELSTLNDSTNLSKTTKTISAQTRQQNLLSKSIIADMKKLLKYSKVG